MKQVVEKDVHLCDFTRRAGIALVAMSYLLICGCGLTINGGAAAAGNENPSGNPATGGGQAEPMPGAFQPLTGCSNPNTGTSNGDWGVGSNPVFTDPYSITVGTPLYSSNTVFWTSRENSPGQSILLTGAFTDTPKTVRIAPIPSGTLDWQDVVRGSNSIVSSIQQSSTGLSFIVPVSFPAGIYGFEVQDPSAPAVFGLANVPSLSWAIGVPNSTDVSAALQHQVYSCGAEPGGTLRLFGKNFTSSSLVVLQSTSGTVYPLTPSKLDSNSISVAVPGAVAPGSYNVWVGSPRWDVTSSAAAKIIIHSPPSLAVRTVKCAGLVGDGAADNTKRLQSCLDQYAPLVAGRELALIEIPAGTFVLTSGVKPSPFEVLAGSPTGNTTFIGRPSGAPPASWFTVPQYFGMSNLSLQAPANPNLLISAGTTFGDPTSSGHLFFNNLSFVSTNALANNSEIMFLVAGPDVQVYNSYFLSNDNQDFDLFFGDGADVSGNHFRLNNWTGLNISDSQNVIFENNLTDSDQPLNQGPGGTSAGSGLSISRGNSLWGPSALSRDVYVGYNTFQNMGSNSQQVILNDGDGGSYFGPIASSTDNIVTLAYDPWWAWMGTTNPEAASMAIVSGTGVGQYSFLQSYNGRSITLQTPWKVKPDETSIVVISQYELNMTWAHNRLINTAGASMVLADALEGVIEDNYLQNSGGGILLSAFGPYGGPASYGPVIDTDVLRNTIAVGAGTYIVPSTPPNDNSGIGVQDLPGCLVSGMMIRDNIVPVIDGIYSTNGVFGVSAVVVEQNHAAWITPFFPTVGFLVQDNSPPPSG